MRRRGQLTLEKSANSMAAVRSGIGDTAGSIPECLRCDVITCQCLEAELQSVSEAAQRSSYWSVSFNHGGHMTTS